MGCLNIIFPVILYTLGTILLVVLIILCFKVIGTLKKVDRVVDDVENKVNKLDGAFALIDKSTDAISSISDRAIEFISSSISKLFTKKKKNKEEDENE